MCCLGEGTIMVVDIVVVVGVAMYVGIVAGYWIAVGTVVSCRKLGFGEEHSYVLEFFFYFTLIVLI